MKEADHLSGIVKEFYGDNAYRALKSCEKAAYTVITAPRVINSLLGSPVYEIVRIYERVDTISIKATGYSPRGSRVVVYAHTIDHYFSEPEHIKDMRTDEIEQAGTMPQSQFLSLLEKANNRNIFVIDHKPFFSGRYNLSHSEAMENPQLVAALGGENKVEEFFKRRQETIQFLQYCDQDAFRRKERPLWRFIAIGPNQVAETSINRPHNFIALGTKESEHRELLEEDMRAEEGLDDL
jgi:hypothetical protein